MVLNIDVFRSSLVLKVLVCTFIILTSKMGNKGEQDTTLNVYAEFLTLPQYLCDCTL